MAMVLMLIWSWFGLCVVFVMVLGWYGCSPNLDVGMGFDVGFGPGSCIGFVLDFSGFILGLRKGQLERPDNH